MKNVFLKLFPSALILVAVALLFVPRTVHYLDVQKFFASARPYYHRVGTTQPDRGYYYPGVPVGKLWGRLGVVRPLSAAGNSASSMVLRDEYLFGCSINNYISCVLPYPSVKEYELGGYRVLRVSSLSRQLPDYQYLLFKDVSGASSYFGHIDVFDNKTSEPVFKFLDQGLAGVISLAGEGDGYSTRFFQAYGLGGRMPRLLLAVPSEARRHGLGLLDFDLTSAFDYAQGVITGDYRITFLMRQKMRDGMEKTLPLFTATRTLALRWDGQELVYDAVRSDITPAELARIVSGSYARVYGMFRPDFDKLKKADRIRRQWVKGFLSVVQEEGFDLNAPLPGSLQR